MSHIAFRSLPDQGAALLHAVNMGCGASLARGHGAWRTGAGAETGKRTRVGLNDVSDVKTTPSDLDNLPAMCIQSENNISLVKL